MALAKKQKSLSFVSIIKQTTKIAAVHKAIVSTIHETSSSCGAHLAYKGCYLSLGKHQAYKTYYLYFEGTPSL